MILPNEAIRLLRPDSCGGSGDLLLASSARFTSARVLDKDRSFVEPPMEDRVRERGASVVELMMVLGLVGVVSGVAVENFVAAASGHRDRGATAELAAELRAARSLAMTRRERVRVRFVVESGKVVTERADVPGALLREYDSHTRGVVVERLSRGLSIVFAPSGRAATPTTIFLRNARQERWQLTVSITGRVSWS